MAPRTRPPPTARRRQPPARSAAGGAPDPQRSGADGSSKRGRGRARRSDDAGPAPARPPAAAPAAAANTAALAATANTAAAAAPSQLLAGGYLAPGFNDGWTFDDDFNPEALARAAQAAREPPPSPRAELLRRRAAAAAAAPPTVITRIPEHLSRAVVSNGVVLIDKPLDWSALDAAKAVKRAVGAKRAGHAGGLDERATGLVIVCLGDATRLVPRFAPLPRTYSGVIRLGAVTTTGDASGDVVEEAPWSHVTDGDLEAAARALTGEILQVPSPWSGAKVHNRPARWYAERGEPLELPPRLVSIESLRVWRAPGSSDVGFRCECGRGACMRALARDFGAALGCGGHLAELRREAVGGFSAERAWTLDVLLPAAERFARGYGRGRGRGGGG